MKNAIQVQVVWFDANASQKTASQYFRSIFRDEPDLSQVNRQPNAAAPHLSMAQRTDGGISYTIQVSQGRIDFLAAPFAGDPIMDEPPTIDGLAVLDDLLSKIPQGGIGLTSVYRQAIVVPFVIMCPSHEASVEVYAGLVPGIPLGAQTTDLLHQINRRTVIHAGGYEINRMIRLSVEEFTFFSVNIRGAVVGGLIPESGMVERKSYGVACNIDCNVNPDGRLFDSVAQNNVFRELRAAFVRLRDNVSKGVIYAYE